MDAGLSRYMVLIVALVVSAVRAEYYCGRANACYMVPSGCAYGDCDFEVVWSQQENTTLFDFKIAARHDGWVAVGLSKDQEMGSDDVYMCIAAGDGARFEHRYNDGRSNIAGTGDGVESTETRNLDGVISCRVERDMSVTNNDMTFDLQDDLYMFFAKGPLLSDLPGQHVDIPKITKDKIDFDELVILAAEDFKKYDHDDHTDDNGASEQRAGMVLLAAGGLLGLVFGRQ